VVRIKRAPAGGAPERKHDLQVYEYKKNSVKTFCNVRFDDPQMESF
jgi:hypothetical protein